MLVVAFFALVSLYYLWGCYAAGLRLRYLPPLLATNAVSYWAITELGLSMLLVAMGLTFLIGMELGLEARSDRASRTVDLDDLVDDRGILHFASDGVVALELEAVLGLTEAPVVVYSALHFRREWRLWKSGFDKIWVRANDNLGIAWCRGL